MRLWICTAVLEAAMLAQQSEVVIRSDVRLVEIYASITSSNGKAVDRLQRSDFEVWDNDVRQELIDFEANDTQLSCALLLDTTGSMTQALPAVKNAAVRFIDSLRPQDSVAVYTFSRALRRVQAFTTKHENAKRALFVTRASGQTAFFDAVLALVNDLTSVGGKKAIVAFTDGVDNASVLRAPAAVRRANRAGIPIYIIAQGQALKDADLLKQLAGLAEGAGGSLHQARSAEDIRDVFTEIAKDLQQIYFLSYKPPASRAGSWRTIRVKIPSRKATRIRAKEGYFAE